MNIVFIYEHTQKITPRYSFYIFKKQGNLLKCVVFLRQAA